MQVSTRALCEPSTPSMLRQTESKDLSKLPEPGRGVGSDLVRSGSYKRTRSDRRALPDSTGQAPSSTECRGLGLMHDAEPLLGVIHSNLRNISASI